MPCANISPPALINDCYAPGLEINGCLTRPAGAAIFGVYNVTEFDGDFRMRRIAALALASATLLLSAQAGRSDPAPLSGEANAAYLAGNAKKQGVVALPGIQYEVLKQGNGAQPARHDCVTVNYKGWLIDGKVFDQTEPGKPAVFPAGQLIPGWVVALQLMHVGDKWQIVVPSEMAYGKTGVGDGLIPPDQTLVFEVELLKITKPTKKGC